jgi:hypothetical protein
MTNAMTATTITGEEIEGYDGLCPICRKTDGFLNAGRDHWYFCREHKVAWCAGSNLYSTWQFETEAGQRGEWNEIGMDTFEVVEPYYPRPGQGPMKSFEACGGSWWGELGKPQPDIKF